MKAFRGLLVTVATAALLMFVWAPWACGQCPPGSSCPSGGCPAPGIQSLDVGGWRASPQSSQRVHGTAPEYVVKLKGGTGTLIYKDAEKGVILTAYHVIKGEPRTGFRVMFPTGEILDARAIDATDSTAIVRDVSADLTLLVTETSPRASVCPIALEPPKLGEQVTICGYGSDNRFAMTSARVRKYSSDGGTLIMSGEAKPGDSGGPIFSANGLVAVVSSSTWADARQPDETVGGHVGAIQKLCQTPPRFWGPWNAQTEQERIRSSADVEMERIRSSAQQQQQQPYPLPFPSGPDPGLLGRMSQAESRITSLESVAEAAKAAAANATTEAGKAFAEAVGAKASVAEEVEKATPGLIEKLSPGILGKVAEKFGWLNFGVPGLGLGLVGVIIFIILKDVRDYIKTGGQDKLIIQHAAGLLQRGSGLTRNTLDDRGADWLAARIDGLASRLDRFSPQQPPANPSQPIPPV